MTITSLPTIFILSLCNKFIKIICANKEFSYFIFGLRYIAFYPNKLTPIIKSGKTRSQLHSPYQLGTKRN